MKLTNVHVKEFESVLDSGEFAVGDITCLVGKNEAGKTAILQALYRLNPIIPTDANYSITDDYPRRDVEDYRLDVDAGKREHAAVVRATFQLEQGDMAAVVALVGDKALTKPELVLSRGYSNTTVSQCEIKDNAALMHLAAHHQCPEEVMAQLRLCGTVAAAGDVLTKAEQTGPVTALAAQLSEVTKSGGFSSYVFNKALEARVPKFLYFDEYYQMKGRASIEALKTRQEGKALLPSDHPLLGLINRARLNLDDLVNPARTRDLKNRLEGAGNHLTKQIVDYWSQNKYLQLRFDVRPARPNDPEDMRQGTNIWSDVYDSKHMVTTELGTRSRGFVWFFSFLAWYGDVRRQSGEVILLLDEPGLSLHGKAQEDLLRYFETEVLGHNQLIYTTHSPFMVDPRNFDRVRIVQDRSIDTEKELPREEDGTKVLTDVLEATADSLFPLQGALGYEIYQTLFIGPNSLVVEGVSDLLYLQAMTTILEERGRTGLSPQWTITPVGGSDKVPTFVALIGAQKDLNVAVLVDFQKKDEQLLQNLYKKKLLQKKKVLTFADFTSTAEADIEDMFDVPFYLTLVNEEFKAHLLAPIAPEDLPPGARVLVRLEQYFTAKPLNGGAVFNHYRPARYLIEHLNSRKGPLSAQSLDRFEAAFQRLNALL